MDHFLRDYLNRGLSDIVSIGQQAHEENSGSYVHHISETVVARKGAGFVRVSASIQTSRYDRFRSGVDPETSITEADYAACAKGKAIIDTAEARARIAHQDQINRHRQKLEDKLVSLTPKCPTCGEAMKMRPGKKKKLFWGCSGYPSCKGTKSLSIKAQAIQKELDSLK